MCPSMTSLIYMTSGHCPWRGFKIFKRSSPLEIVSTIRIDWRLMGHRLWDMISLVAFVKAIFISLTSGWTIAIGIRIKPILDAI